MSCEAGITVQSGTPAVQEHHISSRELICFSCTPKNYKCFSSTAVYFPELSFFFSFSLFLHFTSFLTISFSAQCN